MTQANNQFAGRGDVAGVANWFFARFSGKGVSRVSGKPPPCNLIQL